MWLRITIAMLEIRNRKTLQSKVNICKSDVIIGDCANNLQIYWLLGISLQWLLAIGNKASDDFLKLFLQWRFHWKSAKKKAN